MRELLLEAQQLELHELFCELWELFEILAKLFEEDYDAF